MLFAIPMQFLLMLLALFVVLAAPARATDLNSYRAQHGRAALRVDSSLAGLAYFHAMDMARRGALDHRGFKTERAPLGASAENVGYGCADEACAILEWSRSAPHRAAMLRKDVTTFGVAGAASANGRRYWAMELGGVAPLITVQRRKKQYMEAAAARY
jgi:streptogramin lyase